MVCLEKWLAPAIRKISANKNRPRTTTAPCQKPIASTSLEIAIEFVAMYFLLLFFQSAYEQPCKQSLSAPAKIDFRTFSITVPPTGRSLQPENSLEPTRGTLSLAGPRLCLRAQLGRANRNPSTYAPGSNRTFPLSLRLQERNSRRLPLALGGKRSCGPVDLAYR